MAKEYETMWNFPNCLGALDGKHIRIKQPAHSGSAFYNYKGFFSIILMALVDAKYRFLYVDVGTNGRNNDAAVFNTSSLGSALRNEGLNIPPARELPGREMPVPYTIVGDEIFALKSYLMKPYPGRNLTNEKRIFNYRLSRARRTVENAFGILSSRFRIFLASISLEPEKVESIVLASCALHNFLSIKSPSTYTPEGTVDVENMIGDQHTVVLGDWRRDVPELVGLHSQRGNRCTKNAKMIQEEYMNYFNSDGAVPWQWRALS